jgi:class 3 adenylate cyclase
MRGEETRRVALQAVELFYTLALLAWFLLPRLLVLPGLPEAARFPAELAAVTGAGAAAVLAYLIPAIRVYKLAALFLDRTLPRLADPRRILPILLSLVSSALALGYVLAPVLRQAASWRFFAQLSPAVYALFFVSLAHNAFFLAVLIARINRRDEAYREYLEFKTAGDEGAGGFLKALLARGIQQRLVLSFTALILVVVAVMSLVLMRNFSRTILASAVENGKGVVERAGSIVRANFGDDIAVEDYFAIEARKNAQAAVPFEALTYYQREPGGAFRAAAGTEPARLGEGLQDPGFGLDRTGYLYDPGRQLYEFRSPVLVRSILIGFVQLSYAREVIFAPHFRAQLQVILIGALFLYATVFLVYVVARGIAFPILFLRMSVAGIARTLAGMIKGQVRISAELLQYRDRVRTRDEIKMLSGEIGNMTAVIRGLIPYISASTLRHSERAQPATERRELAFLFTDVRGFTTICEGLSPGKVVELINHYLDLQSSLILANGGDIDKFVGDQIMAAFEGPRKELLACRSAMAIRAAMAEEREQRRRRGERALAIGIGIHSGPVVFGSVGAKDRMDFTSIGDTVNLAARLEGANKTYGTKSLISAAVHAKVREQYLCREIDLLAVKGKNNAVRIFEVLQEHEKAQDKLRHIARYFELGLALYRRRRWSDAEKAFGLLVAKYQDEASAVFLRRIARFRKNPPPTDWDGVFRLAVK